uniref:Major facilitator superfamily (MFS) profile domain-containing protein n=1 Tax=Biomphalaria glabrata TaxID=6526 RepID=A0A2C9LRP1_BIOGL
MANNVNEATPLLSSDLKNLEHHKNVSSSLECQISVIRETSPSHDKSATELDNKAEEKFKLWALSHRKKMVVFSLVLSNFLVGCCFSLLAPFYPQEAEKKDVSNLVTGFIFSSFELTIFVSSPVFGNFMTRIGPRFMLIAGLLTAGSCAVLFGTLDRCPPGTPFIIISFACRCVEALGFSAFITSGFAIISSEFPKNVGTVFALLETADGIGLMVGPALGGALYELGGYGLGFYVLGGLTLATGGIMIFLLPETQDAHQERKGKVLTLLKSPFIWFSVFSIAVASLGIMFLDPTFSKHLKQFDLSPALIGLIFVITPGLYGLTSPFWGYISDTKNMNGRLIFLGNLMCGISYLLIGPSPYLPFIPEKLWVIIIGLVILGTFISLCMVPTLNCLLQGAVELGFENNLDTYGIISGLFNSAFCLGSFTGPMVGGVLIDYIGFNYGATAVSGIHFFAAIACCFFFITRHLKQHARLDISEDILPSSSIPQT